jgi:U3 small nucleolar RNA-associated protein 22
VLGFELNHGHASCEFTFQPPSRVDLVGSFLLKSVARPVLNVDVALEMPKSCLGAKDYLNYRYLEKRACYLDVVAQFLQSRFELHALVAYLVHFIHSDFVISRLVGDLAADLSIAALHDERSRPCLILRPQASSGADAACAGGIDASSSFVIRLFVSVPHDVFPLRKLAPNRNAVRPAHQYGSAIATESVESEQSSWLPTPRYNANVLEDVLFRSHLEQQHAALGSSADKDGVVQAIALFKLWLHLRGLHSSQGRGGLGGFQVSAAALHLIATRRLLPNSMSSYQAFRVLLHFFASHDLNQQPVALPAADQVCNKAPIVILSKFWFLFRFVFRLRLLWILQPLPLTSPSFWWTQLDLSIFFLASLLAPTRYVHIDSSQVICQYSNR